MRLIGLTGNIASGKSTVAELMRQHGATLIDADVLAREVVEVGTPAYQGIVKRWGRGVLAADGTLDRAALRERVFADPDELDALNALVHPAISNRRETLLAEARERGDRIVVCDIPLLFERRLVDEFDRIVLVDAPRPLRLERLVRERELPETDAMNMIAAQMPAELKRARADFIIENAGTPEQLAKQVAQVWDVLKRESDEQAAPSSRAVP